MPGNKLLFDPNLGGLPVNAFLKMSLFSKTPKIKVLCEQTRELTHDFLDYV